MPEDLARHQVEAVEQILAVLDRRGGVLLADEVGLGKSWVAAVVARAFSQRGMEVVFTVPRSLLEQWQQLLRDFDVAAELITHDSLHGKFVFPGVGKPRLLIVDEAHRFRNPATHRHRALASWSLGNRVLLVTATPICNRLEDLYALLRLIAPDDVLSDCGVSSLQLAFERCDRDLIDVVIRELAIRRNRTVLPERLQFGELVREMVRFRVLQDDRELRGLLAQLRFPLISSAAAGPAVLRSFLWRRLESSVAALAESVRRQKRFYRRARESLSGGVTLTKRDYRRIFGPDEDELLFQDVLFREFWNGFTQPAAEIDAELDRELTILTGLESFLSSSADQKAAQLAVLIAADAAEQMLVFSGAIATARELFRRCSEITRAALITSRFHWLHRHRDLSPEQVLAAFRRGEARVLILTDLGAEGLNLQNAGWVVHYDLPWNPVRIDQRNGRIHRIGQSRRSVRAIYFVPERYEDRIILRRIAAKNRMRRSVLDAASPWSGARPRASAGEGARRSTGHPRLTRSDPQFGFAARLEKQHMLTDSIAELLVRRYRHGAEILIREMSSEYLDSARLQYLETMLGAELGITQRDAAER